MASSSHQASKKARTTEHSRRQLLQNLLHTKSTSLTALHDIAKSLAMEGDEQVGMKALQAMNHQYFRQVELLPLKDGTEFSWPVADPSLLVSMCCHLSSEMEELFARSLQQRPCSAEAPWSLVMVYDEFTPGNVLQPQNPRKTMVVNFTFLELDSYSDLSWFTTAVARTPLIKEVTGGWSRMLRDLLRLLHGGPSSMRTAGIALKLKGEFVVLHAKVVCLLSDGDGLKQGLQWNGASSLKPCFRHWNVVKKNHWLAADLPEKYVAVDCSCSSKFKAWSEAELSIAVDVVIEAGKQHAAGELPRSRLEEVQKSLGFKATEDGLLGDPVLRQHLNFLEVVRYDWAHTFLAESIVGHEMWDLIEAAEGHGIFTQGDIDKFLNEPWQIPGQKQIKDIGSFNRFKKLFDQHRQEVHEEHRTIKAGMSELLGLYALLRHFLESRVPPRSAIAHDIHLFALASKAVDLILAAKKRRVRVAEAGAELLSVLEQYMRLRVEARGNRRITPKSHWAFDIAQCMVADDFLVDAFTLERLHRRVKPIAEHCKNLRQFEATVMAGTTSFHIGCMLQEAHWSSNCHMVGKVAAVPGAQSIAASDKVEYCGEVIAVGSFVFRGCLHGGSMKTVEVENHNELRLGWKGEWEE